MLTRRSLLASRFARSLARLNSLKQGAGLTPLALAAEWCHRNTLELLLADHRTVRSRPAVGAAAGNGNGNGNGNESGEDAQAVYDAALRAVKKPRNARFRGLVRAVILLRRMRLRAAQAVYAPGGAGFTAAAASFQAAAAAQQQVV